MGSGNSEVCRYQQSRKWEGCDAALCIRCWVHEQARLQQAFTRSGDGQGRGDAVLERPPHAQSRQSHARFSTFWWSNRQYRSAVTVVTAAQQDGVSSQS
jgi:hypothetical protein